MAVAALTFGIVGVSSPAFALGPRLPGRLIAVFGALAGWRSGFGRVGRTPYAAWPWALT